MKTIKSAVLTIWIVWVAILIGAILFASGPIDLNITNTAAATVAFYGLTFGPLAFLGLTNLKINLK
jgi:hypothetical protein